MVRIPTTGLLILLITGYLHASASPGSDDVFNIPFSQIDRYEAIVYEETVETTTMSRILLKGRKDLLYDTISDMVWQRGYQFASAAFYNRFEPKLRYEVTSFSSALLIKEFGIDLLMAYLRNKEQALSEASYELLLPPERTNGPARFRILGQRTLSFTYSYLNGEDLTFRGENWIEKDGVIHIVTIEAPSQQAFDAFFERVRQAMNSMRDINEA